MHAGRPAGDGPAGARPVLVAQPELVCSAEISRQCGVDPKAITCMVDRLVRDGFLQRRRDTNDRRVVELVPTARGHAVAAGAPAAFLGLGSGLPVRGRRAGAAEVNASAELLIRMMDAHSIARTVLIQVIHYRWDNRYLADVLKRYPGRFHGVARVDPADPARPIMSMR
ncbi:MarR family transcriptional regulator [Burkholderia plantarii]|uniref:MarR family transcriptional regulator n=1 Tax=Burkholderia plantarii TaxID=41899 RepID=UPI000870A5AB|nr:MarR family transcriptional regulator [Burkholderia plantarii]